jgi:hypothetical protein
MGKCPIQLVKKKSFEYKFIPTPKILKKFEKGNKAHILTGIYRSGARGLIDTEKHMTAINRDLSMIFSGYSDFIMIDEKGLYIEDLKTCDRKAFYNFFSDPESYTEKIQVSCYNWLYYIVFGVIINRGVITKIDRDNYRNRISLEIDLFSIDLTEKKILQNPAVLYILNMISEEDLHLETEIFLTKNKCRWLCSYCQDKKICTLNKKLTQIEKKEKEEKKKAKTAFKKLIK